MVYTRCSVLYTYKSFSNKKRFTSPRHQKLCRPQSSTARIIKHQQRRPSKMYFYCDETITIAWLICNKRTTRRWTYFYLELTCLKLLSSQSLFRTVLRTSQWVYDCMTNPTTTSVTIFAQNLPFWQNFKSLAIFWGCV